MKKRRYIHKFLSLLFFSAFWLSACQAGNSWRIIVGPIEALVEPTTPTPLATTTIPPTSTPTYTPSVTVGPVTIYAEPSSLTLAAGESAIVTIVLDTGGYDVDTVDVFLQYDALNLQVDALTPLDSGLMPLALGIEGDTVIFSAGNILQPVRWRTPLATVHFTARAGATVQFSFRREKPLRWTSAWRKGVELIP